MAEHVKVELKCFKSEKWKEKFELFSKDEGLDEYYKQEKEM